MQIAKCGHFVDKERGKKLTEGRKERERIGIILHMSQDETNLTNFK